jgi:hypothetical protein
VTEQFVDTEQTSFEAALAAMDAELAKIPAPAEATPPAVTPAPEQAAKAPETPAPTPESPPAPSAKELERIAALEAREARVREAEEKAKAAATAPEPSKTTNADWDRFVRDPVGYVKRMRPDIGPAEAARIAESFYFDALGDQAPPEHRQRQEVAKVSTEVRTEVDTLRAELQELRETRAREAQAAQMAQYQADLRTGAAAVEAAPTVKALIARNPGRAEAMLYEVARRAAVESKQAGAAEPVVLTGAEAAAKLEAILKAEYEELYGPMPVPPSSTPAPVQNAAKSSPSTTITNSDASVQPTRTTPDPLDDKELRKAALKAIGLDHIPVWD